MISWFTSTMIVALEVLDLVERDAADDAVAQRLDFDAGFDDGFDEDAVGGAAVALVDDDVLRHVDEAAGEVAGIGGLERRIGQALTRAVRRDEVLQHVEAFAEVGRDRRFDDFAATAWPSNRAYRKAGGSAVSNRERQSPP